VRVVFAYVAPRQPNTESKEKDRGLKENDHLPHGETEERMRGGPASGGARHRPERGGKREGGKQDRLPFSPRVGAMQGGASPTAATLVAVRRSTGEGRELAGEVCGERRAKGRPFYGRRGGQVTSNGRTT
jgi:hypothetical protein